MTTIVATFILQMQQTVEKTIQLQDTYGVEIIFEEIPEGEYEEFYIEDFEKATSNKEDVKPLST